jgi:hypothetical protein
MADEVVEKVAKKIGVFIQGVFSEANGSPSSTRILMFCFSFFSMGILWAVVRHMVQVKEPVVLSIWMNAFPGIVTVLIGLIVTPYTINKSTSTMGDIFSAMSGSKREDRNN